MGDHQVHFVNRFAEFPRGMSGRGAHAQGMGGVAPHDPLIAGHFRFGDKLIHDYRVREIGARLQRLSQRCGHRYAEIAGVLFFGTFEHGGDQRRVDARGAVLEFGNGRNAAGKFSRRSRHKPAARGDGVYCRPSRVAQHLQHPLRQIIRLSAAFGRRGGRRQYVRGFHVLDAPLVFKQGDLGGGGPRIDHDNAICFAWRRTRRLHRP